MPQSSQTVIDRLPEIRDAVSNARQTLLANLVMIGEIPAPTFEEQARVQFLVDRFTECGMQNCSSDEVGNGLAVLPGAEGDRNLLMVAHADTVFSAKEDHTISVMADQVMGRGVGDNSLGLAVLATLPTILADLDIRLDANLVLMAGVRSLGRGDLGGLRFFLSNSKMPIDSALCVEGVSLGRLSYSSLGMLRGEIEITLPDEYDWTRFGARSAILTLNEMINRILAIPLPRKPRTAFLMGSVEGGESFDTLAKHARLRFEVRSESLQLIPEIRQSIEEISQELSAETQATVAFEALAQREPGGLPFGHRLVRHAREVMEKLEIEPRIAPSMSELTQFIQHDIPALTLGVTQGHKIRSAKETVEIEPIYTGIAQLIGVLLAMDEGASDEQD